MQIRNVLAVCAALSLVGAAACEQRPAAEPVNEATGTSAVPFNAAPTSSAVALPTASASASAAPSAPAYRAAEPFAVSDAHKKIVDAADRSADDKALDAGRHPGEMLSFFGITQGMRVAELAAGGGYTAELLARTVGPKGKVWGHNSKFLLERFAEKPWSERLKKPAMKGVVRVDRDFDEPLPADAKELDAVFMVLFYHDTVWLKTDRAKMNANIFKALKPGGIFALIDHSGRPGTGVSEGESLHRIDEETVKQEVLAAGFKLDGEAQFLRNPNDTRDWNDSPRAAAEKRGTSDRFVLRFKKQ